MADNGTRNAEVTFEYPYEAQGNVGRYGLSVVGKNGNHVDKVDNLHPTGFRIKSGGILATDDYKWIAIGFIP